MNFTDATAQVNETLEPSVREYDLYLRGGGADISVSGAGRRWVVSVYWNFHEQEAFVSEVAYTWFTATRDQAIRLAWYAAKLLSKFATEEEWPSLIPSALRMCSITGELVPERLIGKEIID